MSQNQLYMVLGLILMILILFSLCVGIRDAFAYDLKLQLNTFKTPYYTLGLMYREWEKEQDGITSRVDSFTIGLIIIELEIFFDKE